MSLNATIVAETDLDIQITVNDDAGVAVDLTGASVTWNLRERRGSAAVLTKTTASGIVLTTPASGIMTITVLDTDTVGLEGIYFHEAVITDAGGLISRVRNTDVSLGALTFEAKLV